MTKELIKKKIMEESDYIKCPKYQNSLTKYLSNNDDAEDIVIARLLMITEEEVEKIYQESVDFLKKSMLLSKKENK